MPIAHDEKAFQELLTYQGSNQRLLVEGDSWVSHPFLPNLTTQFDMLSNGCLNILDLAQPGDTCERMLKPKTPQFRKLDTLISTERFGDRYDAIFLSAAGNDIVGPELLDFIEPKSAAPAKWGRARLKDAFFATLDDLYDDYKAVVALRNASDINATTPIITHAYAYLQPRKVGTKFCGKVFGKGWICVHLTRLGITDGAEQEDIARGLLDAFYDKLVTIDDPRFLIVDTRRVLMMEGQCSAELFHDEIHPRSLGFKRVAQTIIGTAQQRGLWPLAPQ